MAPEVIDHPLRPLTADEVLRMVEAGILSEDEPVELLLGSLRRKMTKGPGHGEVRPQRIEVEALDQTVLFSGL